MTIAEIMISYGLYREVTHKLFYTFTAFRYFTFTCRSIRSSRQYFLPRHFIYYLIFSMMPGIKESRFFPDAGLFAFW